MLERCDKMKRKIIFIIIIMTMILIPSYQTEAKTLQGLKDELAALEKKYSDNQSKKELNENEIKNVNNEISAILSSITEIKNDIKKSEQEIINSQNQIEEKSKETDELLKFLQVSNGENVYLEYLFEADSYTDFIYRYSVVSQLTDYNNNLMDELKQLINTLEENKKELSRKQTTLEEKNNTLSAKMMTLKSNAEVYDKEGSTIEEDIRDYKKEIAYYEKIGCSLNQDVSTCLATPVSFGWRYPLSHLTVSDDYTGYDHQRPNIGGYHHGIDLWYYGIAGAPIYPVAKGTIARIGWISGGGNAIYIYHNVNGIDYTTVYMHMQGFAQGMYQGKEVTTDDVIGYVGNTGESFGAHLHLGIATGHHATFFNTYSIDPRSVMAFPAMDSGVYYYRK